MGACFSKDNCLAREERKPQNMSAYVRNSDFVWKYELDIGMVEFP